MNYKCIKCEDRNEMLPDRQIDKLGFVFENETQLVVCGFETQTDP